MIVSHVEYSIRILFFACPHPTVLIQTLKQADKDEKNFYKQEPNRFASHVFLLLP